MGQLIDIPYFWVWLLLMAPGIAMLIWLVVYLWRTEVEPGKSVEPPAEVEFVSLEQFTRHTMDQLNLVSAVLRRSEAIGEPGAPTRLPVATASVTNDKEFTGLADKVSQLAELTYHMLEKSQALSETIPDPLLAADIPTSGRYHLSFTLDGERFAINASNVHAVVEASQLVTKPAMTSKLRRAIRLGDTLVPVIDLGVRLAGRSMKIGWSSCVVILDVGSGERMQMIGVVVDAVGKVIEISPMEIELPATSDSKIRNDFILGTTSVDDHTLTLLDIKRGLLANEFVLARSVVKPVALESAST
ncbi:chemotaxis protein CheW [Pseudomonas citri]|uniref:chemotaxis protein CheW n=1 Tax=Pseudomonas citri TaxID=2978349 RepID=UPI0021B694B0|nr:chemotaxis protein CheW [Pseudomonas citri]